MLAKTGKITLIGLALLIVTGAAAATPVGGQSASVEVEGHTLEAQRQTEAAGANAEAGIKKTDVDAQAPVCDVTVKGETNVKNCEGPKVETTAEAPTLNVDYFVGFGSLESAPAAEPEARAAAATAARAVDVAPSTALIVTAAAGASALTLYGAWRFLKFLGLAGLMPLYSQISDDEILDDPNRARIMTLVREVPGISTKDLAERLGLAWGTVTHHLAKLEKRRFIVSKKYGKYRRYFVNGAAPSAEDDDFGFAVAGAAAGAAGTPTVAGWRDALAVLRVKKTADVAQFIRANPGFTQKDVSEALGVSSSTILWHVKRLEHVGLVTKVRDGKAVRYYPSAASDAAGAATGPLAVPT